MVFVSFRSRFSYVLFPLLVWLLRKSVSCKKKFFLGHKMGPEVPWPNEARGARRARRGGFRPRKKNPFNNQAGFGSWVQARRSGPGMKKPGPNPTLVIPI